MNDDISRRTLELIPKAHSGEQWAFESVIELNIPLVKAIALRFINRGAELQDLIQIGSIGLIKAVKSFDITLGTGFSTYAFPVISGEIKRFLRDDGIVKVSRRYRELYAKIAAVKRNAELDGELPLKIGDIALRLGLPAEEVADAICSCAPVGSLSERRFSEDDSPEVMESVCGAADFENETVERLFVHELMERLDRDEMRLIRLRYFGELTQSQTAQRLGMSQAGVSRLEKRSIEKLRNMAKE